MNDEIYNKNITTYFIIFVVTNFYILLLYTVLCIHSLTTTFENDVNICLVEEIMHL